MGYWVMDKEDSMDTVHGIVCRVRYGVLGSLLGLVSLTSCIKLDPEIKELALQLRKTAVVIVDLQRDFTQAYKGSLAVPGSDQNYIDSVNEVTKYFMDKGFRIYATQDWHPANHISFKVNGRGGIWPVHCQQNTPGADILLDKEILDNAIIVKKGMNPDYDSYSGFKDDNGAETILPKELKKHGIRDLVIYGIATDYCVKATVLDARAAGFNVYVLSSYCRGVAPETIKDALAAMSKAGAAIIPALKP